MPPPRDDDDGGDEDGRRRFLGSLGGAAVALLGSSTGWFRAPRIAGAYTPDPDPLQESLYFISRVQEATVQQERFIRKLGGTAPLR